MEQQPTLTCLGFKADVIWGGSGEVSHIYVSLTDATSEYYMTKSDLDTWLNDPQHYSYILACEFLSRSDEIEWVFDLEEVQ
jgi:hypothetical protein